MKIEFTLNAWEDFNYWIQYDKQKVEKINQLIGDIQRHPFRGLANPEPLKHELQGFCSRRIDHEHRLVYRITGSPGKDTTLQIIQCRYHY